MGDACEDVPRDSSCRTRDGRSVAADRSQTEITGYGTRSQLGRELQLCSNFSVLCALATTSHARRHDNTLFRD